jgi:hypothetical protein
MERIYDAVWIASCGMIYVPSFMKFGTGVQAILGFCLRNLRGCDVGITDRRDLRMIYEYSVEMASCGMIHVPSLMTIGTGFQAILRFCFRNSRGCYVGITDGRDFLNYIVEMDSGAVIYVPSFIKIGSGIQKVIGRIHRHTHRQQGDIISLLFFSKQGKWAKKETINNTNQKYF